MRDISTLILTLAASQHRCSSSGITSIAVPAGTLVKCILMIALGFFSHSLTAQRMTEVKRNQIVTVTGDHLLRRGNEPAERETALLIFEHPNVLIRLEPPVPLGRVRLKMLRFQCAEVGWFQGESLTDDWTVGKRCRLLTPDDSKSVTNKSLK